MVTLFTVTRTQNKKAAKAKSLKMAKVCVYKTETKKVDLEHV